jgi:hypothetical protein
VLFGGWLLLTGLILSYAQGIIHPYYAVVLAPPVGALVGMGTWVLWSRRAELLPRLALATAVAATAVWSFVLLGWSPDWYPALRWAILLGGLVAAVAVVALPRARGAVAAGIAGIGIAAVLAGPAAYSLDTASTPHAGAIPSAGPAVAGAFGPGGFAGGRGGFPGGRGGFPGAFPGGFPGGRGGFPGGFRSRFPGGFPGGPPGGATGFPGRIGRVPVGAGGLPGAGGAAGGLLNASTPGRQLIALLQADASRYSWVAATTGSNSASGYQLGSGEPVMAIGGFNGTDPTPSLAQFQRDVAQGRIHYYLSGGGFGFGPGGSTSSDASAIATWVAAHYAGRTVDRVTVYDLSGPTR